MENGSRTIANLELGTYRVTESSAIEGYGWSATYKVGETETSMAALESDGDSKTVVVTNNYTKYRGSLTVTKAFADGSELNAENLTKEQKGQITFKVEKLNGETWEQVGNTFTLAEMENGSRTIANLELGTYRVTESSVIEGYGWSVSYRVGKETTQEAVIGSNGENAEETVINNYSRDKGSLEISKKVEGLSAEDKDASKDKEYEFTLQDEAGKYYDEAGNASEEEKVLKVKADGSKKVKNLPTGNYTVKEKTGSAAVEGYSLTAGRDVTVTVSKNETGKAEVTNKYDLITVDVKVKKVWDDAGKETVRPESITVRLFADGTEKESKEVKPDANGKWTWKFEDLPKYENGKEIQYTITEDRLPAYVTTIKKNADGFYTITNTITSVKVSKVDIADSKELEGAHIQILDKNGNVVEEWDSTKEAHEVTGLKTGETYTLRETVAPDGYEVTTDTTFVLKADGTIDTEKTKTTSKDGVLLVEDKKTSVKVSKVDIADGKELEGAHIQILDKNGNVVEEWDSTKEAHEVTGLKTGETYTLRETVAPDGYAVAEDITFTIEADGTVKVGETVADDNIVEMKDMPIVTVSGTKTWNVPEGTELPESISVILNRNGEQIDSREVTAEEDWSYSWTDLAAYSEDGKTAYTYTVDEEPIAGYNKTIDGFNITNIRSDKIIVEGEKTWNVPEGTELPESITVNLYQNGDKIDSKKVTAEDDWKYSWTDLAAYSEDGKTAYLYTVDEEAVEGYEKAVSVYNIVNTITGTTEVSGTKTWNVPEGTELPESITVNLYQNGEQIDSKEVTAKDNWKYSWTDLELYSEDGKTAYTYTVDENPIDGYISTVKDYDITNTITSVKINKVDIADGKLVEGAYLQILDQDGNVVDEWVSTKESHEVTGLMTGETYTLHEMTAPDGYDLTEDTTFVLKEDGTIDADKTTAASKDGVLLVEDTKTEQTDKAIEVTKKLGTIFGNTLSAEDATYYVALYADEACTKRISNVKALEFKNASSSTVTFENLKEDTTYYVGECTADGTSYKAGTTEDGVRYTVNFGDGNRVTIEKADGTKEVHFDNVFLTIPDGYNVDASLKIVKKVVDVDGNAKETNETFYAGLFADKECTTLSDAVSKNIIELNMNGSAETNVEITVPLYPAGTVVNLYVAEVDKDGNLVTNDDKFAYDVEVTNGEVTLDAQNDTAEVTITNSETSEEESESESETESESESETETEKQTETESETESKGKKPTKQTTTAAKTGDNTPIGALAGALAVSAAVIVVYIRRRRKNEE